MAESADKSEAQALEDINTIQANRKSPGI